MGFVRWFYPTLLIVTVLGCSPTSLEFAQTPIPRTLSLLLSITSPAPMTVARNGLTVQGVCMTGVDVEVAGPGNGTTGQVVPCVDKAFTAAVVFSAGDGVKTIQVSQFTRDTGLLVDARDFLRDNTPPALLITGPAPNSVFQGGLTLVGTCESGYPVTVNGAGMSGSVVTACASGLFSANITLSAPDGVKNIVATQTDGVGLTGTDNRNFIRDATAPAITITAPAANSIHSLGLTLTGTCENGLPVTVAGTGASAPVTTACAAGAYSAAVTFSILDGVKNITASQTDAAGNVGTANRNFVRDTTAPVVTINTPAANTTGSAGLTITGNCESGISVVINGTGVAASSSVPCAAGSYTAPILFSAGDGPKTVTANQTDAVGNTGSATRNFVRDTSAPVIAFTLPAAGSFVAATAVVQGTCEAGLTVTLGGAGLSASVNTPCAAGTFSNLVNFSAGDGNKLVTASQTDAAGNTGTANRTFVRDTTAPAVAITSPAANTVAQNGLTVGGTCENGLPVDLSGAGIAAPLSTACAGGTFSAAITFSAGDGVKNIVASQTDLAGNTGSSNRNFIRDTVAPAVAITSPAVNATIGASVMVGGTCETGLTVVLAGTGALAPVNTPCAGAVFSASVNVTAGDGIKNITATQTDAAGNVGSSNRNFVRDSTGPVLAITAPPANSVHQNGLTLMGICETGLPVNITGGVSAPSSTACVGNAFSQPITFSAGDGVKNIVVTQTDGVGNTSTDNRNFIKDTTAPLVAITSPAVNTSAQNGLTVGGTCENGLPVDLSGAGISAPLSTACAGGTFSAAITFSAGDGVKNIVASQTDAAGNTGTSNRNFVRDTVAPAIAITSPAANSNIGASVVVGGTCETGLTVVLAGTGALAPVNTPCAGGVFSASVNVTVADGIKNITATQTDAAGNVGTDNRNFAKDLTGPLLAITGPAANSAHQMGLTLVGICEVGFPVNIAGAVDAPSSTACVAGNFSQAITFSAGDGVKNITASQTDGAMNTTTDNRNFIKDTTAPVIAITSPANGAFVGASATITGTCETGITVVINGGGVSAAVSTACAAGGFSAPVSFTAGDGNKVVVASQTDGAANTGSASRTYVRDGTAPIIAITSPAAGTVAQNGLTISGTCEAGLIVNISGAGVSAASTTGCPAGNFTAAINFSAGDGVKNVVVAQTDGAGNTGTDNRNFTRDSAGPLLAITGPAANSAHQTGVTLVGICETGFLVNITGGVDAPSSTACVGSAFSQAITFSAGDGVKNIVVSQTDGVGNTSTDSRNFVKDTIAPLVAITSPANGAYVNGSATITGTCETGITVVINGGGVSAAVSTACAAGGFSAPVSFTAGDGNKVVVASQTDAAGNTGSASRTYVRDGTAPLIAITSPAAGTVAQNGLTVSGTCETGLVVNISGAGVSAATTTPCAAGAFSIAINFSAGDGVKNVVASQTDAAGNTGTDNRNFARDSTGPLLAITAPAANSVHQLGLTLVGICETGFLVNISGGVSAPSSTACVAGNFSQAITFSAGDGVKNIAVSQTDGVGNTSNDNRNFVKDTVAPVLTITSPVEGAYVAASAIISGSCETGLTVTISGPGVAAAVSAACAAGAYSASVNFTAGDGNKQIIASQTDGAGNVGSATRNVLRDGTAPAIAITAPAVNTAAVSGLTVSGTCEAGLTVTVSGPGVSGSPTGACIGTFSIAINFSAGDGIKIVNASQTDIAGNTGTSTRNFIRDATAPVVVITSPAAGFNTNAGIVISGTCETGLQVDLSGAGISAPTNTPCVAGGFTRAITFSPGDGPKNIVASQTDGVGNTGSSNRTFNYDTTAPVIAITAPAAMSNVAATFVLSGNCETGLTVNIGGTGASAPSTTGCVGGVFSASVNLSAGIGNKDFIVAQTDAAGNLGSDARTFVAAPFSGYETFTPNPLGAGEEKVDILFVDDNSASMDSEQAALSTKFPAFISELTAIDWQVGVTTTDVSIGIWGMQGRLLNLTGAPGKILLETTPNADTVFRDTIVRPETIGCIPLGTCPSGLEQPLRASIMAMDRQFTDNVGFFRPDADLAIVILSDENEMSDGRVTATQPQAVIDHARTLWPTKKVSAHAVVILPGDVPCFNTQQSQFGATAYYGTFAVDFANRTGGSTHSICAGDYTSVVTAIGQRIVQLSNSVQLARIPIPGSVVVAFTPAQPGITFTVSGDKVIFSAAPPPGVVVEVWYNY